MSTFRGLALSSVLILVSVSLDAQGVSIEMSGAETDFSPAARETILLMRDLLLENENLSAEQRKHLGEIKPGESQFSEMAARFERKYNASTCKERELCLEPDVLAEFRRNWNRAVQRNIEESDWPLRLNLKTPAKRRSALLGLQLLEDARQIDPRAQPGFPWCIVLGGC